MRRHNNWPTLLAAFIEERRHSPFAWGSNDCCLFAADWIRRACGVDFAEDLRGTYASALSAARVLRKNRGVIGLAAHRARLESKPLDLVQRGDLVGFQVLGGIALGICLGHRGAVVGANGLEFPEMNRACAAWKV
jgi:hypothetical protein